MFSVKLKIYKDGQLAATHGLNTPLRLGRQTKPDGEEAEPAPISRVGDKIVIATGSQNNVARNQARIELLPNQTVTIRNLSKTVPIRFEDQPPLRFEDGRRPFDFDALLTFPYGIACRVEREEMAAGGDLRTLPQATIPPGQPMQPASSILDMLESTDRVDAKELVRWFQSAINVFHKAATSSDFYREAAQAVKSTTLLDYAKVLTRRDGTWHTESTFPEEFEHSDRIVDEVCAQKRTLRLLPQSGGSLLGVQALVAAPILDQNGEVVAVLYGDRRKTHHDRMEITELEALLVEMIAGAVATGIARLEHEKDALEARVRFEQFFTPQLAKQLETDQGLLEGKEAEVSVLFCDIRGFSGVSRKIGPKQTMDWIGYVMEVLSDSVSNYGGVLVDYIGDELMAMWGAPEACDNHAEMSCLAAADMVSRLPMIDAKWESVIESKVAIGIGINSGKAFVGNTGSQRKFKYGPLGNTVNLASRVQGASKYVNAVSLITGETRAGLPDLPNLQTRRLCQVRVINIPDPVDLFELVADSDSEWAVMRERYEQALSDFDHRRFKQAVQKLANLHVDFPADGPTLMLLSRSVDALAKGASEEHPMWVFEGK